MPISGMVLYKKEVPRVILRVDFSAGCVQLWMISSAEHLGNKSKELKQQQSVILSLNHLV